MSDDESLVIPETLRVEVEDAQIVEVPLEQYLKGVVAAEMGPSKPLEALKAQAIAARSYAVSSRRHAQDGADVCATTHCQAWDPHSGDPDSDHAVDETSGQVVTYGGRIVGTPYFGHCDGHTRNSEDVWSRKVGYCQSVPCICGHTELHGHGVGMCQRGAVAMAQMGATCDEILKHYYRGIEVAPALPIPRAAFRRSILFGKLVDGDGNPLARLELAVRGDGGVFGRRTNAEGHFWVSGLPAGTWEVRVRGKPVRYKGVVTDGRNAVVLRVAVPDAPPLMLRSMPLAFPRKLIGTLGFRDVQVFLTNEKGEEVVALGGSEPYFDPGGFAIPLPEPGIYTVRVLGQSFELDVSESGLWIQFVPRSV
jgi:hypothetical protein